MNKIIEIAKSIINQEAAGLAALSKSIDDSFLKAIELLSQSSGKIILSGMGKSGHIAKKIAATFSSTGTSAIFLHPSEASHGDLGMINKKDIVILYSNSGETKELNGIINYCNRFDIEIIGITKQINSTLGRVSNIIILLPQVMEASNLNAPSTSTTMMMALGDALALTLASIKGFSNEDFTLLHPGGAIGTAVTKVKDIMHTDTAIPLVYITSPASEMLIEMTRKRMGCVGVIDNDDNLIGVVTDGDLRRHIDLDIKKSTAADFMTYNPVTIGEGLLAVKALRLMNAKAITSLFIVADNKPVGIMHLHDLLRIGIS